MSVSDRDAISSQTIPMGLGMVGDSAGLFGFNNQLQLRLSSGVSYSFKAQVFSTSEIGSTTWKIGFIFHESGMSPQSLLEASSQGPETQTIEPFHPGSLSTKLIINLCQPCRKLKSGHRSQSLGSHKHDRTRQACTRRDESTSEGFKSQDHPPCTRSQLSGRNLMVP